MASQNHGSDQDIRPGNQSIPLQDLSRPPEAVAADERGRRRRTNSAGSPLSTHGSRRSLIGRGSLRRYERIAEDSPSPIERTGSYMNQPTRAGARPVPSPYVSDPGDASPIEDPAGFAAAMTSVGLSFDGPQPQTPPSYPRGLASRGNSYTQGNLERNSTNEMDDFLGPTDTNEDTTPLTNRQYLQPMDGASDAGRSYDDRSSTHTVHLTDGVRPGSRLGDDLPNLESGTGRRADRSRSLSPSASGSALSRAGSMMRMMSQRVVNLSNEPEVVEQSLRRRDSLKSARLEGPPPLPAMTEYAHDTSSTTSLKVEPQIEKPRPRSKDWRYRSNPLRGRSLGILAPDNPLRMRLCDILVHPFTEPFILIVIIVQTVLLAVESAHPVFVHPRSRRWGSSNLDYAFFVIFIIYTLELIARILVSGFIKNPTEYSTLNRSLGARKALAEKTKNLLTPQRQLSTKKPTTEPVELQPSVIRTFTGMNPQEDLDDPLQRQRVRLAHRAFLRHSFNRLDFVAVISFWISFGLSLTGYEFGHHMYVFQMMSCLRILRLLGLTNGTSVILRSLKKAAPLLVHVAFLIGFFWLLFAIVGIQSFKSSLRRTCTWIGQDGQDNFTSNDAYGTLQFCGGYLDAVDGSPKPWVTADGVASGFTPKGYLCPQGSVCVEGSNPYNGTVSFDNILQSLELVFVVMSSNTFTDLMYYTTDSDYLASALFFAFGIVILSLWLVNLLVAVITSSFQVIREESKRSAFAVDKIDEPGQTETTPHKVSQLKRLYEKTYWLWISVIAFDLVVQCLRSSTMGEDRAAFINNTEVGVTFVLLIEIILRFASDWRRFHKSRRNWVDLALAVITCVILLPPIRTDERAYSALTLFQVLRIYRIVLAFAVTRDLIMIVFRNTVGLLNLILFVFLITFLAAIFAAQLFRGQIPQQDDNGNTVEMNFFTIYNSFLGMYQILSSENWTTILYDATNFTSGFHTSWISASFFIMWFILASFIILNMFIAVIQESFDVSEDEKRLQQVKAFLREKHVAGPSQGNLPLLSIFKFGRNSDRYRDPLDHGPAALEMLLKDAVVHEFLDEQDTPVEPRRADSIPLAVAPEEPARPGFWAKIRGKITSLVTNKEPNPFYSKLQVSREYDHLDPRSMAREVVSAAEQRKRAQREYLQNHPNYNKSLFIFAPNNPVRRFCQRIVGPGRGTQRFEGVDPYKPVWYTFSAFIYAAIVAMVLIACITTPIYQRDYSMKHRELVLDQEGKVISSTYGARNWYVWTDMGFAALFTIEAIIKVIADGLFWTPNAYFRSSWGFIDGVVLITLWINVITSLFQNGTASRAVGAFKALRALRLLNVSDSARDTFHSVIILGGWKVISAAFVSMSFLIPFAIYGLTLFNGQMISCNDDNIPNGNLSYCVDEYMSSPYNWDVLAPRVAANSYYSFDNFGDALFILFQIVSQEGWIDVQWSAMSMTGKGHQPQPYASQANGLYFIVFNLLGAVFVLTLFVSVFMRNYTEQTGVAFLTAEQRSWLELRKLLRQISPSKRSINARSKRWKIWCYRIAVKKHGRWPRCVTTILLLHLTLLILEFYPSVTWWDTTREALFFVFTWFYIANVVIRIIGLGWHRFRKSSWDLYSVLSVSGTFITTLLAFGSTSQAIIELNKLFLVSITLLIIPRNNQLDQLFKTAAASLTAIGNLLATWFVLFLVYAIAMTQTFGLTKFGSNENNNLNFRDVPKALIFLFRTSCGEGWNQLMEDFATMQPPQCTLSEDFFGSDCGSPAWARGLFITWNIISMYIFVSLFVSLIFESFSYVYQRSSGLYAINREELRRFKQAWSTFDPDGTGYISKEQFPRLLGELSGIFEMRVYDGEFTVGRILERCRTVPSGAFTRSGPVEGVDLDELRRIINRIPVNTIRARRAKLNVFYEEVLVSADPDFGISFTSCLMILAHHNVISDSKSLRLEEFLRRRTRLQRVEETVRRKTVIGFFDTLYWSRQFRRNIQAKSLGRMTAVPQFAVPEIFVDHGDGEGPEWDNDNTAITPSHASSEPSSPMLSPATRNRGSSIASRGAGLPRIDTTLAGHGSGASTPTEWAAISPSLSPRRPMEVETSYFGASGPDDSASPRSSRDNSGMNVNDVMESLDNSAWGESIRRSFTQHRSRD
ncbi:hypothetical protein DTO207G8_55 [Paecilomyces variotii]|nr:hypothetical protein DTO032I3_3798 [Paecilomyces variotii]KAJ9225995.1 hypothetical protein DTO169C6_1634 [Paecilomyces variotii]KAJ9240553.1 hypothetical protein DTO169E5_3885 [Paecilomyces variotii]KAJ9260905.1 hypothetical protein DTO207G8_55 [Paecilomyces variotii]KAJ9266871.1 hypothetical protein DTO195F2_806 [Paecilomyces variotii]